MEFSYRFCDKELGLKPRMGLNMNSRRWQPTEENNTHLYNPQRAISWTHICPDIGQFFFLFNPIQGCRTRVSRLFRRLPPAAIHVWPFQGRASYLPKNNYLDSALPKSNLGTTYKTWANTSPNNPKHKHRIPKYKVFGVCVLENHYVCLMPYQ